MENNPWGIEERFKRASTEDLKRIFQKYASVYTDGEWFITSEDFIRKFLGLHSSDDHHPGSVKLLAGIIDASKDGLISFREFQAFEGLLCVPDALYYTAFQLFDTNGNGIVSYEEFKDIISQTTLQQKIPFDLDGQFADLYFGEKKDRVVTYSEFCQFLHDFHEEYGAEAFRRFDEDGSGFIDADSFQEIMVTIRSHLLTRPVITHMKKVVELVTGCEDQVSYPYFVAFNSLLAQMELAKKVYLQASGGERDEEISKDAFLHAANMMSHITPLQVDILFHLSNLINDSPTMIYTDLEKIAPEQYYKKVNKKIVDIKAVQSPEERSLFIEFLESMYRFTMGIAAGAAGAFCVYPMDLVKTRMQLQRPKVYNKYGSYKTSLDCLEKAFRNEGLTGLYRGLLPQLVGVAIGKALKLTINDYIRDKLRNRKGKVPLRCEIFAGACAGASNVLLTNPLEAVKIRIQVASQIHHKARLKFSQVVRELGFKGLYRGLGACILRDVPFCAIFFPTYAHLKVKFQDENGYNSPSTLLYAGILASIPGAPISMPFDMIKTRLQAKTTPGQSSYKGILDATVKIYHQEGFKAFWQGTRLIKPPSQFGLTLLIYEVLQRLFYVDFAGSRPSGSEASMLVTGLHHIKSVNPDHVGGYALALPILAGIESKFGLVFPKFRSAGKDIRGKGESKNDGDKIV